MTNMKKRIAAALVTATLTIGPTIPAMAVKAPNESVRVSSYKGSTLEVGERRPDRQPGDTARDDPAHQSDP